MGLCLPKWLRSAELYRRSAGRNVWVNKVIDQNEIRIGDILLFSHRQIKRIQDPRIYCIHLGVCVDTHRKTISHASRYLPNGKLDPDGGKVYSQRLEEVLCNPKYDHLVGIRRVKQ